MTRRPRRDHRVLVTDGGERAALALVRALGAAGHHVVVASRDGRSLAGASRFARADCAVGDPLATPEAYAAAVLAVADRVRADAVIPVSEASLLAVLPARDTRPGLCFPFPSLDAFRKISDKAALTAAAPSVGIAVPAQRVIASPRQARALRHSDLRFPLVVKPTRSVAGGAGRRAKLTVSHAWDAGELQARLAELDASAFPVLVQERIVGPGVGIFLLLWEGETLATFSHRRIREKPPAGGISVYRESIPADPDLVERSIALLERFGWQGVAMVEYKIDDLTGTPYLMEVNGRFWGSLQLALDAGVDFPNLLLAAAFGEAPRPVDRYRAGVRSRWWWGDVDHLIARLLHSPEALALPPDAPSRWRAVWDFLTVWRAGDRNEILRLSDPRPFFRETAQWFGQLRRTRRESGSSTSTATTPGTGGTRSISSARSRSRAASGS